MKIKQDIIDCGGNVSFKMDVGGGQFCRDNMPVATAVKLLAENPETARVDDKEFPIKVGKKHFFPASIFEAEEAAPKVEEKAEAKTEQKG